MKTIYKGSLGAILGLCLCLSAMAQDLTTPKADTAAVKKYKPFNVNCKCVIYTCGGDLRFQTVRSLM